MSKYLSRREIDKILDKLNGNTIDFDQIDHVTFPRVDIYNCVITGTAISSRHLFGKGNLLNCELRDFTADQIDFGYVDIKDCIVKQCVFLGASFDFGAFINNVFHRCRFDESHFQNLSITESKFYHVEFVNCNLENMVIKGCKFNHCRFINCKTSNKLIESSCIFDCEFENTEIQIETITENFGITRQDLREAAIRSGRKRNDYKYVQPDELYLHLDRDNISAFENLKVAFFLNSDLFIKGDDIIDDLFQIDNWLTLCRIPSTFTNLLELFLEFLLYEYEKDNLILFILIKFHDMTGRLIDQVKIQHELYQSVIGVHMTLAREVESFLMLIFTSAKEIRMPNFAFKANGPVDRTYYERELSHFLLPGQIVITNVRKMNSPNILSLLSENVEAVSILLGLLFSARVKLELSKYYPEHIAVKNHVGDPLYLTQSVKGAVPVKPEEMSLFNIEVGLSKASLDEKHLYSIKLRSIMPGHLLATLRLDVSTKAVGKLRNILVDIIKKES